MTHDSKDPRLTESPFPPLPLEEWEATKATLHKFLRLLGKVRVTLAPPRNHWWNSTMYLSAVGVTTGPIFYRDMSFDLEADLVRHRLRIRTSKGGVASLLLGDRTVAKYHAQAFSVLRDLGVDTAVFDGSADLESIAPTEEERSRSIYDPHQATRFFHVLTQVDRIFKQFGSRFLGKTSPVHFFGHSFDLAVTRFSGRRAPGYDPEQSVNEQGYSHEVISFGFWTGDEKVREPAFYSYTAPEPEGLAEEPLSPEAARWEPQEGGSRLAFLAYEEVRNADHPDGALLAFLESAYQAGAKRGGWEVAALSTAPLRRRSAP